MTQKSYVEFYGENKISPVNYQLSSLEAHLSIPVNHQSNLENHFAIRKWLYHYLGILPAHVKGRRVLEVGPGSGYNALYTAHLKPAIFDMVEPNPTGVATIKQVFPQYGIPLDTARIHPMLIQDFPLQEPYDFVFCEGMIGGQVDPHGMLMYISKFVAPGGVLVTTTVDPVSFFADLLRRLLGRLLAPNTMPVPERVVRLVPVFKPHLDALVGMNRKPDDWVLDNIINPACTNGLLTLADCLNLLGDRFLFLGSSPSFFTDWTWYKAQAGDLNQRVMDQYWRNVHNFFDYRKIWPARDEQDNRLLNQTCLEFHGALAEMEHSDNPQVTPRIRTCLGQMIELTTDFAPDLADALKTYIIHLDVLNPAAIAADEKLGRWFGRGQQNISFCENSL